MFGQKLEITYKRIGKMSVQKNLYMLPLPAESMNQVPDMSRLQISTKIQAHNSF